MAKKHTFPTQGEWKWYWGVNDRLEADCGVFSEAIPGQAISVCRAPRYEKEAQWKVNAHLITAAPIGYELAEAIIAQEADGMDRSTWILNKAKEFIKKCEGRE